MKKLVKTTAIVLFAVALIASTLAKPYQVSITSDKTFETHETTVTSKLSAGVTACLFETLLTDTISATYAQYDLDIVASANDTEGDIEEAEIIEEEEELEPVWNECDEYLYASTPLNVRSGPSSDYEQVGFYSFNATVHIIGRMEDTNWVQVDYNGTVAYVHNEYLSSEKQTRLYLGRFRLTGYDACVQCCGKTDGITASGTRAQAGRTVAMDGLPFGTKVLINDHVYIVEDRGGAIGPGRVDIYFNSHAEAAQFAVQYSDVYIVLE